MRNNFMSSENMNGIFGLEMNRISQVVNSYENCQFDLKFMWQCVLLESDAFISACEIHVNFHRLITELEFGVLWHKWNVVAMLLYDNHNNNKHMIHIRRWFLHFYPKNSFVGRVQFILTPPQFIKFNARWWPMILMMWLLFMS